MAELIVPKCSFRVIGLANAALESLQAGVLQGVHFRARPYAKDPKVMVLALTLDERTPAGLLQAIVAEKGAAPGHDFVVSINTDVDTAMVEIPPFVLALHAVVGGSFHFSFTIIGN